MMLMPTTMPRPEDVVAPTRHDVVFTDGTARLLHFRATTDPAVRKPAAPVLLVPSLINKWYILDLRRGSSVAEALVEAGHDVWLIDWGTPRDEDRFLTWDLVVERLSRMARRVRRLTGAPRIGMLGYCLGATLASIHVAREPDTIAAFVNLAGPVDFSKAGRLGEMVDARWFDPTAITAAGNLSAQQMQSGFIALRPTQQITKWVGLADRGDSAKFRESFVAMETWGNDNIPFPAAAYVTYIEELYQQNRLVEGELSVLGERVDLGRITCPILTIGAARDTICPVEAAQGVNRASSSTDETTLTVPGGHVGAVVGSRAARELYPALSAWFHARLDAAVAADAPPTKPTAESSATSKKKTKTKKPKSSAKPKKTAVDTGGAQVRLDAASGVAEAAVAPTEPVPQAATDASRVTTMGVARPVDVAPSAATGDNEKGGKKNKKPSRSKGRS